MADVNVAHLLRCMEMPSGGAGCGRPGALLCGYSLYSPVEDYSRTGASGSSPIADRVLTCTRSKVEFKFACTVPRVQERERATILCVKVFLTGVKFLTVGRSEHFFSSTARGCPPSKSYNKG